jgi:GT2 family glycosyltransferase
MPTSTARSISVAIATLDRPDGLRRCIDAVLQGEVLPTEMVVVDQGQDPRTPLVVARHGSPVPIQYARQDRLGLAASRNLAISLTGTNVAAFTDDDCVPGRGWVAAIVRALSAQPSPGAVAGRVLPLGDEAPGLFVVSPRDSTERRDFHRKAPPWLIGSGGNFAVRRGWLDLIGGFDERLGVGSPGKAAEDMDLIYRLLRSGAIICYEPDAVVYHERQSRSRRLASRWSYGYGMGAFLGKWLRDADPYALTLLSRWMSTLARELAAAVIKSRTWLETSQRLLSIGGTLRGLTYGLTLARRE